jgi:hypothetical protein
MKFIVSRGGNAPDIVDRKLRSSDLPQPMTNATADRLTQSTTAARQRALMRVSGLRGFADAVTPTGDVAADTTGAMESQGVFGVGAPPWVQSALLGVGTIVVGTWLLRWLDKNFGGDR